MNLRGYFGQLYKAHLNRSAFRAIKNNSALRALLPAHTISTGAQYTDYLALYTWVKRNKPAEILELGPGVTTLFLAQAVKENGIGRITAMEDIEKYFEETKRLIPPHLASVVDLKLSPARKIQYGPFVGKGYTEIPERDYDFVYIDGPNYDIETEFNADIIEIVRRSKKPLTAMLDSRTGSALIYHLVFGNKFTFDYLRRLGLLDRVSAADVQPYTRIVAQEMKKRVFKRWL